jgi:hypothetical protein
MVSEETYSYRSEEDILCFLVIFAEGNESFTEFACY